MTISMKDLRSVAFRSKVTAQEAFLWARGYEKLWTNRSSGATRNIYFATVQRSGSQWLKSTFEDPRVQQATGLAVHPQHRYEWNEFRERFPAYTVVPGLYMSYDLYDEISRPEPYKTIYVLRDPRDIAVSWYWAARDTHPLGGKIGRYRDDLRRLDYNEGLAYSIRALAGKFTDIRTWIYNKDDPHVKILRFEDLTRAPVEGLQSVFDHCGLSVQRNVVQDVVADHSKAKMRERDLRSRGKDEESHYRKSSSDYRTAFTSRHHELFAHVTGDLIELLGYATS